MVYRPITKTFRRLKWSVGGSVVAESSTVTLPRCAGKSGPKSTPSGSLAAPSAAGASALPMASIAGRHTMLRQSAWALVAPIAKNIDPVHATASLPTMSSGLRAHE
jgi:hypothetical protein